MNPIGLLAVVVVLGVVVLAERASSTSAPSSSTRTIYVTVPSVPATPPVASSTAPAPSPSRVTGIAPARPGAGASGSNVSRDALLSAVGNQAAPFAPQAASQALGKASDLARGVAPSPPSFAAPTDVSNARGLPSFSPFASFQENGGNVVSGGLGTASELAGQVNGIVPLVGLNVAQATKGFRGASQEQQTAQLGQLALGGMKALVSLVPFVGSGLAAGLGAGAQTYEGKRAVMAAGRVADQGYEFDKRLFSQNPLDAFSGGGSDHETRVGEFFNAINARVGQLATGRAGALTQKDIDALGQAQRLGLRTVWSNGKPGSQVLTLQNLNLTVGANPFAPGGSRV